MVQVLHITPHLGGGIGKVLSELTKQSFKTKNIYNVTHKVMCLEQPEKLQFIEEINKSVEKNNEDDGKVVICPSFDEQKKMIDKADIVQIELFDSHGKTKGNSPMVKYLQDSHSPLNNMLSRTVIWYHNNGLYDDFLTHKIISKCDTFLFTSPCSYKSKNLIQKLKPKSSENNLGCVFASGGFSGIPKISSKHETVFGCFKQLNPTKLHPNIDMYIEYTKKYNCDNNIKIYETFIPDILKELVEINVIIYLLNPKHFGCSENLLLECMSMGIVPIIFNNPAEKYIVKNGKTGFLVDNISEFNKTIHYLCKNPMERQKIGMEAAKDVRERFSIEKTESELNYYYNKLMRINKSSKI